jgi:hypothetical protein
LTKQVEGDFCLWKELVPRVAREGCVNASKDATEVGFEGLYGTLGGIGMLNIGGNKLIGGLPVMCDGMACQGFGALKCGPIPEDEP